MDMNNFRPESHVAQQSRRDKLRVHQNSTTTTQHLVDYTSNLDVRYTNLPYDTPIFSSEMLNFATNSQILSPTAKLDRPLMADNGFCASSSNFNPSSKSMSVDPQNCTNWKSVGSQQSCDWTVNYSTGYQEEMHFKSLPLYQNTLQEIVTKAPSNATGGLEMESPVQRSVGDTSIGSWRDNGNELLFIPYGDQSNSLCHDTSYPRINRPVESGFQANKSDSNTQGLSLSLSSVPMTKTYLGQFGDRNDSDRIHSRNVIYNNLHDSKKLNYGCLDVNCEQSIGRITGQDLVGTSNFSHRNSGPLGPFTGYATILKNSKFLKPTQQLLDEFCGVSGPKIGKTCEASDKIYEEVRVCAHSVQNVESVVGAKGGDSGTLSSTFRSSNDISGEGGVERSSSESFQPEYQTKKAKLLYMHDEVCKRYKHYHQQIQMVVSSFESVAGLNAATPCVGLALKTVSRHFRCLKNAISEQLGRIRNALGEDLSSPTTGTSSCKGDTSTTSRLNLVDRGFQKHRYGGGSGGGGNVGFFEPQQHVWRPQRGLPDRAVVVLRAWLFDHFLHPYPTDTDKHMLASQTGLSRNQVSNWFINARVRVWKPMVEEIHHLETKGLAEPNSIPSKVDGVPFTRSPNRTDDDQMTNRLSIQGMSNNQVECSRDGQSADLWNHEKRSRTEFEIPASTDLSGFVPFERGGGFEIGGLGSAVSLTLGLRQSAESAQQRQQEHRLRQHFGGQMMIHDFVG